MSEANQETLKEFKESFFYGSRTDLLFKFVARLSDQEAAEFFRELLQQLGDAFDTANYDRLLQHAYQWQVRGYTPKQDEQPAFRYDTTPWSPLRRPLSQARIALISTGGLFVRGDDPLGPDGPTQEEVVPQISQFLRRAPILSVIPRGVDRGSIRVRHPGYDIRGTLRDYNVIFPLDRLKELEAEGMFGELSEENYSFVGATSQKHILAKDAPQWAEMLKAKQINAVLLVGA